MPIAASEASNPRFCWGKFEEDAKGRLMMPFTLVANHALADGVHFGRFFMELEERLQSIHF